MRQVISSCLLIRTSCLILMGITAACSVDSARNHYVLAEKLWTDRNYSVAVAEFDKVIAKDPRGKLGLQALYRSAMTQFLFLGHSSDAIRKFRTYVQLSGDPQSTWDAELQIGEILFSKTEQYDQAILHYQSLLKKRPNAPEAPEFLFRIGKSHFFLFQFSEALESYRELIQKFPLSNWAERASFEVGTTYLARGEPRFLKETDVETETYTLAMKAFERFLKHYPKSSLASEARFGVACCLEELDRLEDAYEAFVELTKTYPSLSVIRVKLTRIRERLAQKGTSR